MFLIVGLYFFDLKMSELDMVISKFYFNSVRTNHFEIILELSDQNIRKSI